MGKIYDALEKAEKEYISNLPAVKQNPVKEISLPVAAQKPLHEPMDCYEVLKTNVKTRHSGPPLKTILFCGTNHGDGASTTAINFASTLAGNSQLKVLLIECTVSLNAFVFMCSIQ